MDIVPPKPVEERKYANTTSSLFIDSTISSPNVLKIIQSVATILNSQMLEDKQGTNSINKKSDLYFFSEEKYIEEKPGDYDEQRKALLRQMPTIDSISEFVKALFDCAQFSAECCIICLIYINRIISFTDMPLQPTNWRPLTMCALQVAQKVWDDKYLSNADFAFIYPFFTNQEINKLETKFLELIQYNVTVKAGLYARYYFELRGLYKNDNDFPLAPLDVEQGKKQEAKSRQSSEIVKDKAQKFSLTYNEKEVKSKAKTIMS